MRVLFLTHRLPYAADRGDRLRALHILQQLAPQVDVDLLSLVHDEDERSHASDLRHLAASVTVVPVSRMRGYVRALAVLPTEHPFTHAMLYSPEVVVGCRALVASCPPDVVLAYCSGMARFALEEPLAGIPLVLDMVDVDSEKWKTLGRRAAAPSRWIYAAEGRRLSAFEALAARSAERVLVVNERERASVLRLEPDANVTVVPNGLALDVFRPREAPSPEPRVVFCGVMNYAPNAEAAVWFARKVWPAIRRRYSGALFSVVGSGPTRAVRRLAADDPSIEVTGAVPDVRPYLWRAAVSVAPLFVARGVQNKVLEALGAGLPTVVTPAVCEGLPTEVLPGCSVAESASGFADAVIALLGRPPADRRAMAARADLASLGWDERLGSLVQILADAARGR